jgi:hypothetical protein
MKCMKKYGSGGKVKETRQERLKREKESWDKATDRLTPRQVQLKENRRKIEEADRQNRGRNVVPGKKGMAAIYTGKNNLRIEGL